MRADKSNKEQTKVVSFVSKYSAFSETDLEFRFEQIFEFLPDATIVIDKEGKVVACNRAMEELTGIKSQDITSQGYFEYSSLFYGERRPILIDAILNPDVNIEKHYTLITKRGETLLGECYCSQIGESGAYIRATASSLYDSHGNLIGAIESFRDATKHKQLEERLRFLSWHDSLTGLKNRTYFEKELLRLDSLCENSIGIIVCDVDGLKLINDSLGHKVGDEILMDTASVLKECFREGDFVSRIGGDEFAIVLENAEPFKLERIIRRIRRCLVKRNYKRLIMPLSLSLGYSIGDLKVDTVIDLYKKADNNMYREKLQKKQSTRSTIVKTLMKALETKDVISEDRAERLVGLVGKFATYLGLSEQVVIDLLLLARLHDIGKAGIPDHILKKSGPLTPDEYREMQKHCKMGYNIALSSPYMVSHANWILKHHEWWNGQGYPLGLRGDEIPLECRVLAIVDAYDAMTHDRPYRPAMNHELAVAELQRCAGTQFDPGLAEKFIVFLQNF